MDVDELGERGSGPAAGSSPLPAAVRHGWEAPLVTAGIIVLGQLLSDTLRLEAVLSGAVGWVDIVTPLVELLLAVGAVLAWLLHKPAWLTRLVVAFCVVATASLSTNVIQLMLTLDVRRGDSPTGLLIDALLLWTSNVLVFALWYWVTDQGGPQTRRGASSKAPDLLFPQYAQSATSSWEPRMVDYVFLGFISATTFGPADTLPLSRRAKFLMLVQVSISLVLLSFIAARALGLIG